MFFFNCLLVVSVSRYVARTAGPKHVFTSLAWYTLYFGIPLLVFAELLVVVITWRRRMDLMRASAAAMLGFLITNKVGSPQYLIWLLPFLPALADRTGRPARVLFTACCLAMLASSFASRFYGYLDLRVVLGYDLKNLLLVGLFALLLFGPDGRPVPAPEECTITS